ncbi:set5, partial [Symbiodinium sp. KB8]
MERVLLTLGGVQLEAVWDESRSLFVLFEGEVSRPAGPGSLAAFLPRPLSSPPAPRVLTTRRGGLVCARPVLYLARRAAARRRLPRGQTSAFHHARRRFGDPAQSAPSRRRAGLLTALSAAQNHLPPPRGQPALRVGAAAAVTAPDRKNGTGAWLAQLAPTLPALRASGIAAGFAQVTEGAFQVQDLGPKGMGVVAARDIEKGELLLKEQPLLVVPVVRDTRQLDAWEQRILADLADCPQQQQDSFWELADCHSEVGQKTATGIVRTNGLPIERADGADVVGLYSTMSRFNHSCVHNVNNSYQEDAGGEVLHALRNIRKGEELCITYI